MVKQKKDPKRAQRFARELSQSLSFFWNVLEMMESEKWYIFGMLDISDYFFARRETW